MLFGNSENPHRCNALTKHLFRNDLVSIIYASCDQSSSVLHIFRVNQRSNQFLSPELIRLVLLTTLCVKLKMLLLSMHRIAYAFGKFGYTNVHPHENSVPPALPLWIGNVVIP
jgi:hypothetical protein